LQEATGFLRGNSDFKTSLLKYSLNRQEVVEDEPLPRLSTASAGVMKMP